MSLQLLTRLLVVSLLIMACSGQSNVDSQDKIDRIVTGADRLFTEYEHLLIGKNVALTSNHSGRTSDGHHLADLLHEHPDIQLIALFGMEFNIRSNDYSLPRDAESDIDPQTGVPKHSLYGHIHKPTPEMLEGVEVMVFDIQEVGARFYEHINILGFVMEAAAEHDIHVIVLDRPNPITGNKVDGYITDEEFFYTFGAYTRVPVIHGMTMGELALLYNGEKLLRGGKQVELTVIEMQGWERWMWLDDAGIEFSKPSPNLPTLMSTLVYTGTCLFEGLNLSEGRGTERPFEYIGAPWLDHHRVTTMLNDLKLPGVRFEPIEFTPVRMPFHGRDPFLTGVPSNGIFVNVTDRDAFEPYKAGVAMVWAIHQLHPDELEWNERTMLRLTSTRRFMDKVRGGAHYQEIVDSWKEELDNFMPIRDKYLLY